MWTDFSITYGKVIAGSLFQSKLLCVVKKVSSDKRGGNMINCFLIPTLAKMLISIFMLSLLYDYCYIKMELIPTILTIAQMFHIAINTGNIFSRTLLNFINTCIVYMYMYCIHVHDYMYIRHVYTCIVYMYI